MNRETEYRGKRVDNSAWVYGTGLTDFLNIETIWRSGNTCWLWSSYSWIPIIPSSVGQYTGRKDTHANKLFGGDIVSGKWPYASKGVIVWDDNRCGFFIKPLNALGKASYDPYYKMNSVKNIKRIGNIHDTEEPAK